MKRRRTGKDNLDRAFNPELSPSKEHRKIAFDLYVEDVLHDMMDSNVDL
jgi:hypothetical protein